MNDIPRAKLVQLITERGRSLADDARQCQSLLADILRGEHGKQVKVLTGAIRAGVVADLLGSADSVPIPVLLARLAKKLHDQEGTAEDLAHWAVGSWALALGLVAPESLTQTSNPQTAPTAGQSKSPWYYSRDGQDRKGPISAHELKELAASGQILQTDLIWKDGLKTWLPAKSVKNLFPQLITTPPSRPLSPPPPASMPQTAPSPSPPARSGDHENSFEQPARRQARILKPHHGGMFLTLGIISFFTCPFALGPVVWVLSNGDLKEMRARRMDPQGEGSTNTARVLGMISTLLGVLCCGFYLLGVMISAVQH